MFHSRSALIGLFMTMAVIFGGGAMLWSPAHAAQDSKAKFKILGVRVAVPVPDEEELKPFNFNSGTTIAVRVDYPGGGLIEIDRDKSKLQAFIDDKGTNLLEGEDRFGRTGIGSFPTINSAGDAAMIEVSGPSLPAVDATKVIAKGKLVVRAATKKKTFEQKNVVLKVGGQIKAGDVAFEVKKFGKSDWEEDKNEIEIETKDDVSAIADVRFLDAAGKDLEIDRNGSMSFGFAGNRTTTWTYTLPKGVKTVTVEIDYWLDMKDVELSFGVATGLGVTK